MHLSRRTVLAGLASLGIAPMVRSASTDHVLTNDVSAPANGSEVFRIGVPAKALTTDPAVTNDIETHRLARQVYQTLIGVDGETGETIPQLAADWTVSTNGREVVFELAPGR